MALKECPVCHARCFEDMEVCYGCLHSFVREGGRSADRADDAGGACAPVLSVDGGTAWRASVVERGGEGGPGYDPARRDALICASPASCEPVAAGSAEARAAAGSRLVHVLDIVIGIRMAQDASERAAAAATLPVWMDPADAEVFRGGAAG